FYAADIIKKEIRNRAQTPRPPFKYVDLGQMATIGRSRAISELRGLKLTGVAAGWLWLLVHIYRLSGLRNRLSVPVHGAWSYMTLGGGARLIVAKDCQSYPDAPVSGKTSPTGARPRWIGTGIGKARPLAKDRPPRNNQSRKFLNCSAMSSLALRASRIASCKS